jgi:hypothetical protein
MPGFRGQFAFLGSRSGINMNRHHIISLLTAGQATPKHVDTIANYIMEKVPIIRDRPIADWDIYDITDQREFGRALFLRWASKHGPAPDYPDNSRKVAEVIATAKLNYRSLDDLAQRAKDTYEHLMDECETFKWGDDFLGNQEIDVRFVANTIWIKRLQVELTPRQADPKATKEMRHYQPEELEAMVIAALVDRKERTYGQMAAELGAKLRQTEQCLIRLSSDPCSPIYRYTKRGDGGPLCTREGKPIYFYIHAPERKQLDARPGKRHQVIRAALAEYLAEHVEQSRLALKKAMVTLFVRLDKESVDKVLDKMEADGEVEVTRNGPHNRTLYSLW